MLSKAFRLAGLAAKQLLRHPVRTSLTLLGVTSGMFLFTTVQTMQTTLDRATRVQAADTTLVVYRENRFCPQTSRLPSFYEDEIRRIPGAECAHFPGSGRKRTFSGDRFRAQAAPL